MGLAISTANFCILAGASDLDRKRLAAAVQMVSSLALFSCTTHISGIYVVRDHYHHQPKQRNVPFALGALLVGLVCGLGIITESDKFYDYSLSVKCAITSRDWYPRSPGF